MTRHKPPTLSLAPADNGVYPASRSLQLGNLYLCYKSEFPRKDDEADPETTLAGAVPESELEGTNI